MVATQLDWTMGTDTSTSAATQTAWVLRELRAGRYLTDLDALREVGCRRLAARVYDAKRRLNPGERIVTMSGVVNGKRFGVYRLVTE